MNGRTAPGTALRQHTERLGPILVLGASATAGLAAASHYGVILLVLLAGLFTIAAIASVSRGLLVGLLIVAAVNGIPGVNFNDYVAHGKFRPSDIFILALFAALAHWYFSASATPSYRLPNWIRWWSVALAGWWLFTLFRTYLFDAVPLLQGALFARDFLYFAIALPLLVRTLQTRREILIMLGTLYAGAVIFAIGQISNQLFHLNASWAIHSTLVTKYEGVNRFYSPVAEIVLVTFALGLGLAALGRKPNVRLAGLGLAFVCGTATVLSLTRAIYVGITLGILLVSALWFFGGGPRFVRFRQAAAVSIAVLVLILVPSMVIGVSVVPKGVSGLVGSRIHLGLDEVRNKTGNFGYRYRLYHDMWHVLGKHWPIGLGFWHPAVKPVRELPNGSIRNGDVGLMNGVMTMGVIGTLLLYVPLLGTLRLLLSRRGEEQERDSWARYGAAVWLVGVAAGSLTLATLFSLEGLLVAATVIAASIRLVELDQVAEDRLPAREEARSMVSPPRPSLAG